MVSELKKLSGRKVTNVFCVSEGEAFVIFENGIALHFDKDPTDDQDYWELVEDVSMRVAEKPTTAKAK